MRAQDGTHVGKSLQFSNSQDGYDKLLDYLQARVDNHGDLAIGMEATGHYWLSLYSFLFSKGYRIHVVNPIQSDSLKNFNIRQTKTDTVDCFLVAQVIRFGQFTETQLANEELLELRNLARFRESLKDSCADYKRQVITVLDQVFPVDPDADLLFAIAQRVDKYWWHPWSEATLLYEAAFLEFIAHLYTRAVDHELHNMDTTQKATIHAKRWIEAHVDASITLDDIARAVSLSKYHLLRTFRETFGVPPLQYHRRLRMQHARRLLAGRHLSVNDVAQRVGYVSASAFSKAFKREYGVAPSELQRTATEGNPTESDGL